MVHTISNRMDARQFYHNLELCRYVNAHSIEPRSRTTDTREQKQAICAVVSYLVKGLRADLDDCWPAFDGHDKRRLLAHLDFGKIPPDPSPPEYDVS